MRLESQAAWIDLTLSLQGSRSFQAARVCACWAPLKFLSCSLEAARTMVPRQPNTLTAPPLPLHSHSPLTSLTEANDLIAAATLPTKRQHKLSLQQAIRQVEGDIHTLQAQYLAVQPALQTASQEIAACKALVAKVSCQLIA